MWTTNEYLNCDWSLTRKGGLIRPYWVYRSKDRVYLEMVDLFDEGLTLRGTWFRHTMPSSHIKTIEEWIGFLRKGAIVYVLGPGEEGRPDIG